MSRPITDHVLNLTGKLGVHPHKLTPQHVMDATSNGTLTAEECEQLFDFLDGPEMN